MEPAGGEALETGESRRIEIKRRISLVDEVCYLVTAAEFIAACLVRYPGLMI